MIKRNVLRFQPEGAETRVGGAVWVAVGRRLQHRRTELGISTARVAQWAEIPAETYEGYENGAPISASLLAQLADLFEMPLVRFFQGIGQDDREEEDATQSTEPVAYRVATVEHRIQALAESFRKLDFEGQQHLLALSKALCRSDNAGAARE